MSFYISLLNTAFLYRGMKSRLMLAALHFNGNANHCKSKTKEGKERYSIAYPKYKSRGYIVRQIKTDPTYSKDNEV